MWGSEEVKAYELRKHTNFCMLCSDEVPPCSWDFSAVAVTEPVSPWGSWCGVGILSQPSVGQLRLLTLYFPR